MLRNSLPFCLLAKRLKRKLACSRLSDSGEETKVKGTREVGGEKKRKKEGRESLLSFLLRPSSAHFWHVWDNKILAVKLLKCQWVGIFLKFLARLFGAALIPYASVRNLECKKRIGRQHTTFTSCQNAACSNKYFLFRVDYAQEGSTFWLSNLCCRLFHAERSWHAYWFSAVIVSCQLGMIDDFPSDERAFSLTSFEV